MNRAHTLAYLLLSIAIVAQSFQLDTIQAEMADVAAASYAAYEACTIK